MNYLEKIKTIEHETPKNRTQWLVAWRELADVTYGIKPQDFRFESIMRWLNVADVAFTIDSWPAFCEAADELRRIAKGAL
jgi:hypothetical protein